MQNTRLLNDLRLLINQLQLKSLTVVKICGTAGDRFARELLCFVVTMTEWSFPAVE